MNEAEAIWVVPLSPRGTVWGQVGVGGGGSDGGAHTAALADELPAKRKVRPPPGGSAQHCTSRRMPKHAVLE